jgi:putative transposase
VQTPFRAPNCNSYAERFDRAIKEESPNCVIPLGERHLRRTVVEFVAHCHGERHHGLRNDLIDQLQQQPACGLVRRRQRLGGILSFYYRAA